MSSPVPLIISERRPDFVAEAAIQQQAQRITDEFSPYILKGIETFLRAVEPDTESAPFVNLPKAWLLAVRASRYNAAYGVSRREALSEVEFINENADRIDNIGTYIDEANGVAPIINYAFHAFVKAAARNPRKVVSEKTASIAGYAIQAGDSSTLFVKAQSQLLSSDAISSYERGEQMYDWHDLAHIVAASSSEGAFGAKYHNGLDGLERYYRAITEGAGMQDATGPVFSDGLLFSQLSRPLLEHYESKQQFDGAKQYTYDEIQVLITKDLFQYLGGDHELFHPGTGRNISAGRPIDPLELAVCIQNKRYERRASEVETEVFVRGTPDGPRGDPDKDPLYFLSRSKRLEYVASLDDNLLYFEARNVTRHRAHEDALGQFAIYLLEAKRAELITVAIEKQLSLEEDIRLLEASVAFFKMEDIRSGKEINLYMMVGDIIEARKSRDS